APQRPRRPPPPLLAGGRRGRRRGRPLHPARSPVMPGVQRITGRAVAINRANIDTDQIIPASWLKRVERTGFEAGLFGAWRGDPDFPLNRPGAVDAKILVAG